MRDYHEEHLAELQARIDDVAADNIRLRAALRPILQAIGASIGPRSLERHFQVFGTVVPQLNKAQVDALQSALEPARQAEGERGVEG